MEPGKHDLSGALLILFRRYGVRGDVRQAEGSGPDEAVFVVSPEDAATMRERELTAALQEHLRRTVWVTTADIGNRF